MFRALRPYLRSGDSTGLASSDPDTIVESIWSGDALVVPVITAKAAISHQVGVTVATVAHFNSLRWLLSDTVTDIVLAADSGVNQNPQVKALEQGKFNPGVLPE